MNKYNEKQIDFCIKVLKNKRGCESWGGLCEKCCIKQECYTLPGVASRASKKIAIQIIKEIISEV